MYCSTDSWQTRQTEWSSRSACSCACVCVYVCVCVLVCVYSSWESFSFLNSNVFMLLWHHTNQLSMLQISFDPSLISPLPLVTRENRHHCLVVRPTMATALEFVSQKPRICSHFDRRLAVLLDDHRRKKRHNSSTSSSLGVVFHFANFSSPLFSLRWSRRLGFQTNKFHFNEFAFFCL